MGKRINLGNLRDLLDSSRTGSGWCSSPPPSSHYEPQLEHRLRPLLELLENDESEGDQDRDDRDEDEERDVVKRAGALLDLLLVNT